MFFALKCTYRVYALRIIIHMKFVVCLGARNGRLRSLYAIDLVIGAVDKRMERCAHALFRHLTLIHVSGRLIEIGKWRQIRHHTENICVSIMKKETRDKHGQVKAKEVIFVLLFAFFVGILFSY